MTGAVASYRQLEKRIMEGLDAAWDAASFDALWLEVFRFQRRWNQPYANFCATLPEPRTWQKIPAVPQSVFKRFRLSVMPPLLVQTTFRTSGTTGEGFGQHHLHNTRLYDRAILAGWRRLGLPAHPMLILAQPPEQTPYSSLNHMWGALAAQAAPAGARFFLGADGGCDLAGLQAALTESEATGRPVALLGTSLAFLNYFEALGDRQFRLPAGSWALETGGYKGSGREIAKEELYGMFGNFLGLPPGDVLNEYSMTELSSQFYARGVPAAHTAPPWLRALVIDPESGEEAPVGAAGFLRLFDLANLGSVLALETRDLAIRRPEGFELLGRDPAALPRGCSREVDARWPRA